MADRPLIWHRPYPGTAYWDYRCLVCNKPVKDHANWWQRFQRRHNLHLWGRV